MNTIELNKILKDHAKWLKDKTKGKKADLQYADLRFSVFPLWCGSFYIKNGDRIVKQLLSHIARINVSDKQLKKFIDNIPSEYKNDICKRHAIEKV